MSRIYDNWDRLVTATLRREELKLTGQRTPSDVSSASILSDSSSFTSARVSSFNFPSLSVGVSFSYHQILLATDHLNETSNLIKRGHSGDLFYGVLEGGIPVVVQKIDLSSVKIVDYVWRLGSLGKLPSHSRLVSLLGHCLDDGSDKFLVYKYMYNRDLFALLFSELDSEDHDELESPLLDWKMRLKIALGVAEALFYLHHQCVPPLVHGDIQASSILLDENFEVRLGSLTEVCLAQVKDGNQNRFARFLRLPKGAAQETTGTIAYDIYCFGNVLLQLITGKPSLGILLQLVTTKLDLADANGYPVRLETDPLTGKSNDPEVEHWMANILAYVNMHGDRRAVLNIVDSSLNIDDREELLLEVWAVAVVAKACLNPKPSRRPRMKHILEVLRNPLYMATEEARQENWLSGSSGPRSTGPPASLPQATSEKRKEPLTTQRSSELELEFY